MGKRLEIMLVGTYHVVGGVVLTPLCIKAGIGVYGKAKWDQLVRDISLGVVPKKQVTEVAKMVGDPLRPAYQLNGIGMHGTGFGFEVFFDGEFIPVERVDAELDTPSPVPFMKQCKRGDILAMFFARRDGAISFRWDDVDDFSEEDICLNHVDGGPMLGGKGRLQVAVDVLYQGKAGRRKVANAVTELSGYGHVFHKAN